MDFSYTEQQIMFKETVRKFAEKDIAPLIPEMEEKTHATRDYQKDEGPGVLCRAVS